MHSTTTMNEQQQQQQQHHHHLPQHVMVYHSNHEQQQQQLPQQQQQLGGSVVVGDPLPLLSCSSLGDHHGLYDGSHQNNQRYFPNHVDHKRIIMSECEQPQQQQQQYQFQQQFQHQQHPITTPWPAHIAKQVSDKVHRHVRQLLRESRLATHNHQLNTNTHSNTNANANANIRLVTHEDVECVEQVLGCGAFSQVSAVRVREQQGTATTTKRYACKHLKESLMTERGVDDFALAASELACEAHILSSLDHPNIMKIRGWTQNGISSFESGRHDSFFLLLDVLDETLDHRIDRWKTTCTPASMTQLQFQTLYLEKIRIMGEMASALTYIHSNGIIFRDLKPNNIGFNEEGRCILFDFGLSRELPSLDTSVPFCMSGKVGTLRYMAPEVAKSEHYNVSADVYSWAMVAYEVLSLEKPFDGWTRDMHANLVCGPNCARPSLDPNCTSHPVPDEMTSILERTWSAQPSQRGTMAQLTAQFEYLESRQVEVVAEQQLCHDFQQQQYEFEREQEQRWQLQQQQQQQQQQEEEEAKRQKQQRLDQPPDHHHNLFI